uniref:Uncharacterized protein n=1 Tax=Panagrolaimus davidi TaxID=227884 RepID=A0A914QMF6_9BILA
MSDLHNSFMAIYRKWAELKTKLSKTAKEKAGEKQWKELSNDIVRIKLQMTTWRSDIEKHKADRSILGFFANSASAVCY